MPPLDPALAERLPLRMPSYECQERKTAVGSLFFHARHKVDPLCVCGFSFIIIKGIVWERWEGVYACGQLGLVFRVHLWGSFVDTAVCQTIVGKIELSKFIRSTYVSS